MTWMYNFRVKKKVTAYKN